MLPVWWRGGCDVRYLTVQSGTYLPMIKYDAGNCFFWRVEEDVIRSSVADLQ